MYLIQETLNLGIKIMYLIQETFWKSLGYCEPSETHHLPPFDQL